MSKYVQNYRKSVILTVRKCSYRFYFTVKYKIFANFTMIFFENSLPIAEKVLSLQCCSLRRTICNDVRQGGTLHNVKRHRCFVLLAF